MKFIKNNINTFLLIIITSILVTSISVYATYKHYAENISFSSSNESWDAETVEDALNDLYTTKNEVIENKNSTIAEQQKTIDGLNITLSTLNTSLNSKNKTIAENDTTIENLSSNNASILNSLAKLDNGNCISGSYKFVSSCTTSTGCKLLDFDPDIFVLYITAISNDSSTTAQNVIWYNNEDISRSDTFAGYVGSSSWSRETTVKFTDRTISTTNAFYFKNIRTSWLNETAYYIACT